MKMRLADYVADFVVNHGITDCFTVTGGGAMHLNDALGHKEGLRCLYNHHEQACAIAAEAYARRVEKADPENTGAPRRRRRRSRIAEKKKEENTNE